MHQIGWISLYNRILIVLLNIICNFENAALADLPLPSDCKAVQCYSPPADLNCTLTGSINPKFLQRIGPLKDCCPSWHCTDGNKFKVLFMGMKGTDPKQYRFGNSSRSSTPKGTSEHCSDVHCPKLTSSSCAADDRPDKTFQLLHKDYAHCCPTMYCQEGNELGLKTRMFFVSGGMVPTEPDKVLKEKGIRSPGKTCSKISCSVKPTEIAVAKCEEVPAKDVLTRKEVKILGEFLDCCPTMWQCTDPDESKYNVFEMAGESFWYYSTVLQESPIRSSKANVGHCENISCPVMKEGSKDVCTAQNKSNSAIVKFIGKHADCCPLYSCNESDGFNRISFNFIEGDLPESDYTEGNNVDCDDYECGAKKNYENTTCWVNKGNSSGSIGSSLGIVRDCCPVWKCAHSDGTFYNKYKIMVKGFLYKEIQTAQKDPVLSECKVDNDTDKRQQDKTSAIKTEAGKDTGDSSIKTDKSNENVQKEQSDDNSGRLYNGDSLKQNLDFGAAGSQNRTDSDNGSSSRKNNKAVTEKPDGGNNGKSGGSDEKNRNEGGAEIKETDEPNDKGWKQKYDFDPGHCDVSACIKPVDVGQCQQYLSHTKEVPKPYVNCCPSYTCHDSSKGRFTDYSIMLWGKIPKSVVSAKIQGRTLSRTQNGVCSTTKCDESTYETNATCSKLVEGKSTASKVLGDYRDCCDMLSCTLPNGTTIRHFGMLTRFFRYTELVQYTLASNSTQNTSTNTAFNISAQMNGTVIAAQKVCPQDEVCPKPEINGTCYEELSMEAMNYVPEKESCCPLIHCNSTDNKGPHHTQFVKYSGTIPTTTGDIKTQKGSAVKGTKCPKITCTTKPSFESVSCTSIAEGQPVMAQVKPFVECCGMLRCTRQDGSYFIEFKIGGASFKYHEALFFNIPQWPSNSNSFYNQYKNFVNQSSWAHSKFHNNTIGSQLPSIGFQPPMNYPYFTMPAVPHGIPNGLPVSQNKTDSYNKSSSSTNIKAATDKPDVRNRKIGDAKGKNESSGDVGSQSRTDSDNGSSSSRNNKAVTEKPDGGNSKSGGSDEKNSTEVGAAIKETDEANRPKSEYEFDPGHCDKSACTKPADVGQCQQNPNRTTTVPKPYLNCCPSYTCYNSTNDTIVYSLMLWGKIPKSMGSAKIQGRTLSRTQNGVCSATKCDESTYETNATCSKLVEGKSTASKVLGDYRDCCDMLSCTLPNGTTIRHFGMLTRFFRYTELMQYRTLASSGNTSANIAYNMTAEINGTEAVTKKVCPQEEVCPNQQMNGTCYEELSMEAMNYVPEKESCCPLIHCSSIDNKGPHHTKFVKYSGKIPTTTSDIEIQKGASVNGIKCPQVNCTTKPSFESVSCTSNAEGQPIMTQVKPFFECCGMLRCTRKDGSYFIEFRIGAASFKYHEALFFNIPQWQSTSFYKQYKNFVNQSSWAPSMHQGSNIPGSQWSSFGSNAGMYGGSVQPPMNYQHPYIAMPAVPTYGMPYGMPSMNQPMYTPNPTGNMLGQQIFNRVNQQLANQNMAIPG